MSYPASEKAEIIRLVEQSHLPAKRTLDKLGIPRATFYRWYDRYRDGGPEALADHRSRPDRVWNRIPDDVRRQIIDLALELPELSPRELAVRFTDEESIVFVIDDDVAMRTTLSSLFRSVGLRVELFGSAHEFARIKMPDVASCLVLDIRLPGVSGLDFQAELAKADIRIPIIFMTGHGDIPMSVKAMKAGAIDFLTKPSREQDILDAVIRAIERDQKRRDSEKAVSELRILFDSLTSREREV